MKLRNLFALFSDAFFREILLFLLFLYGLGFIVFPITSWKSESYEAYQICEEKRDKEIWDLGRRSKGLDFAEVLKKVDTPFCYNNESFWSQIIRFAQMAFALCWIVVFVFLAALNLFTVVPLLGGLLSGWYVAQWLYQ